MELKPYVQYKIPVSPDDFSVPYATGEEVFKDLALNGKAFGWVAETIVCGYFNNLTATGLRGNAPDAYFEEHPVQIKTIWKNKKARITKSCTWDTAMPEEERDRIHLDYAFQFSYFLLVDKTNLASDFYVSAKLITNLSFLLNYLGNGYSKFEKIFSETQQNYREGAILYSPYTSQTPHQSNGQFVWAREFSSYRA